MNLTVSCSVSLKAQRFLNEFIVPDAIVLDAEQRSALATVRSLGRRGLRVFAADVVPNPLATQSKFCAGRLSCPNPSSDPEGFVRWLGEIATKWPSAVIIPVTDLTVPLCIRAIEAGAALITSLPSKSSYEIAIDKFALAGFAANAGLKVPSTATIRRANTASLQDIRFGWPVVIKPRRSATETERGVLRRGVAYAASQEDLIAQVDAMLVDDADEVLVQQYVAGYGMGVFALYDHGSTKYFFSHRRLRERPPTGGVSVLSESQPLPESIMESVRGLLDQLKWHGVAMVEFKVDHSGCAWLMEINARLWGSVQLAVDCGADFPWFSYQLARGADLQIAQTYMVKKRLRWFLGDLDRLYLLMRSNRFGLSAKIRAFGEFLIPWQPRMRYEIFRLDDMRPAWAEAHKYWRELQSRG